MTRFDRIRNRLIKTCVVLALSLGAFTMGVDILLSPPVTRFVMAQTNLIRTPTFVGKVYKQGPPPTIAGTGSPAVTANSTDFMGEITYGTAQTSAVLTFNTAWTTRPFCMAQATSVSSAKTVQFTVTTTAITFTGDGIGTGALVTYICVGLD